MADFFVKGQLTLRAAAVRAWATQHGVPYRDIDQVYDDRRFRAYLDEQVARVNAKLARYETVKRFAVLHEDFTVENGLLTPTSKIRRRAISERYRGRFEALYHPMPAAGQVS